nr:MAG TPA: hypothetical protein [Caudoviricetes sp.]
MADAKSTTNTNNDATNVAPVIPPKKDDTQKVTLSVLGAMGYAFKAPIKAAAFTGMLIGAAADGLFEALPNVEYVVRNGTKLLAAGMAAGVQTAGNNIVGEDFDKKSADDLRQAFVDSWKESDEQKK